MMQVDDLYRQVIIDHYKNPRNRGQLEDTAIIIHLNNPTCGDRITLQLKIEAEQVTEVRFIGEGCSISMASASMMTEAIKGKTIQQVDDLLQRFSAIMQGEPVTFDEYEDLEALSGVCKFPARIKCATLAWNALQQAINKHK